MKQPLRTRRDYGNRDSELIDVECTMINNNENHGLFNKRGTRTLANCVKNKESLTRVSSRIAKGIIAVNPYLNTPPTKLTENIRNEADPLQRKLMHNALGYWKTTVMVGSDSKYDGVVNRVAGLNALGNWNEIEQYRIGDMVNYAIGGGDFYGMITKICTASNTVEVFWVTGLVKQHSPDDVSLITYMDDTVRDRFRELAAEYIQE